MEAREVLLGARRD